LQEEDDKILSLGMSMHLKEKEIENEEQRCKKKKLWFNLTRVNSTNVLDEGLRIGGRATARDSGIKIGTRRT
jgi:hypothetical protein